MRLTIFKTPQPKRFSYTPRYWDERKEELDKVRKRYQDPQASPPGANAERLKGQLSGRWKRRVDQRTRKRSSAITLLVYLLLIALLAWFIFT
ncbi:MAG TPA: hypothetical protein P5550_11080 [Bacteroidales bacterium]|nr:hypothetical protein [Bacteroidales bacterium]HRZ77493.1 hypothetical protein [Bacteroidales bacterium]